MLKKPVLKLLMHVKKEVSSMIEDNPYGYIDGIPKIASEIEKSRKYRIKDYEEAINQLTNDELALYKSDISDEEITKGSQLLDTCKKVVQKAKEYRREKNKKTNRIETNLLTHAPYFVGGSKKRKDQAKKEGYIKIDKEGIRKMTYQNNLGHMLTMADAKTLFALFSIWEEQNYGEWVTFTEYQIVDRLDMGMGGKQYQIVRSSLEKLRNTSVVFQEAHEIETGKRVKTERFDLIIADESTIELTKSGDVNAKQYRIQFSPHIEKSFTHGYYTFISIAVFNELDVESAQALYVMISGIASMESTSRYIKSDGVFEIPLVEVYGTLFLEDRNPKNKAVVEKGCEELKSIDIIKTFSFIKEGRSYTKLVIEITDWLKDVLGKKDYIDVSRRIKQLSFSDIE
ncbi:replication initiator protein A [Virgibacillus sp. AGTR]|uniref:replication initiator protein A n=1 Tax=Virgibacillus sp. AGTR TaxID=2812055 RepID=UPI001D16C420|nr:replication initiator protein A [Virgibacillus sp. AGTR]MCC2248885.1 replication initiator protein A [Virgibacillus sp. AGTR]